MQAGEGRHAGRWRVQYAAEQPNGAKKRLSKLFPTQREGNDFLRSLKKEGDRAAYAASKETTFGEWCRWLAENDWLDTLDEKTIRDWFARYRKYGAARWEHVPRSKIDPLDVKVFYRELRLDGVGEHTCRASQQSRPRVQPGDRPVPPRFALHREPVPPHDVRARLARSGRGHAGAGGEGALLGETGRFAPGAARRLPALAGLRLGEQMALTCGQVKERLGLIAVDRAVRLSAKSAQTVGLPKGDKAQTAVLCDTLKALLLPLVDGKEEGDSI